jgi:arsenate reductase-like glutaredoxin family protein
MVAKRATFISYGNSDPCAETKKFIEEAGVVLDVRDLEKAPLSEYELHKMIGHLDLSHFLNTMSDSYTKGKFDGKSMDRNEVIKLMAADYTLIKRPIIRGSRLLLIGCDKKKISEMLQLNNNSGNSVPEVNANVRNPRNNRSRSASRATA